MMRNNFGKKDGSGFFSGVEPDQVERLTGLGKPDDLTKQVIDKEDFERIVKEIQNKDGENHRPKVFHEIKPTSWKSDIVALVGEKGWQASQAIALIKDTKKGPATGFLVHPDLLMTNHHVFPKQKFAKGAKACFGYVLEDDNLEDEKLPYVEYIINPDKFYYANKELDFSIVWIDNSPGKLWGFIPLPNNSVKPPPEVIIIQHPKGRPKEIVRKNNSVVKNRVTNPNLISYIADTDYGSSGSPIFDENFNLIAIHTGGDLKTKAYNRGYLISAIVAMLTREKIYPFNY